MINASKQLLWRPNELPKGTKLGYSKMIMFSIAQINDCSKKNRTKDNFNNIKTSVSTIFIHWGLFFTKGVCYGKS